MENNYKQYNVSLISLFDDLVATVETSVNIEGAEEVAARMIKTVISEVTSSDFNIYIKWVEQALLVVKKNLEMFEMISHHFDLIVIDWSATCKTSL